MSNNPKWEEHSGVHILIWLIVWSDVSAQSWPVTQHMMATSAVWQCFVCVLILQFLSLSHPTPSSLSLPLSLTHSLHCSVVIQLSTPFIIPPLSPAQNYYFFDVLLVENKSIFLAINLSSGMGSHTWVVGATTFSQFQLALCGCVCVFVRCVRACVCLHVFVIGAHEKHVSCLDQSFLYLWGAGWEKSKVNINDQRKWREE